MAKTWPIHSLAGGARVLQDSIVVVRILSRSPSFQSGIRLPAGNLLRDREQESYNCVPIHAELGCNRLCSYDKRFFSDRR